MRRLLVLALALLAWPAGAQVSPGGNPTVANITGGTISGADVSGAVSTATGSNTARTDANRAADVFNISDYGAKCDGTTNDNAAINATFAAAAASPSYQNNNAVTITGPSGSVSKGCVMNSINATNFQKGTGANLRPRVVVRDMTLMCTGAGNVCFDALGSDLIKMSNVSIRGDGVPNTPEICIQIGMINSASAAWHGFDHVNCNNEFALTALYNFASEAVLYNDVLLGNNHTASGPIRTLGTITGGSGYTNGTYTNVPLTGGVGTGALANITVSGGIVTAAVVSYQGRDYATGDNLSADPAVIGVSGTGFLVPVTLALPYSAVLDGQNYWRAASAFQTETLPINTWQSLSLNTFVDGSIRNGLWAAWTSGLRLVNTYINVGTGNACVYLFDNGTPFGISAITPNGGMHLELNCEGGATLTSMFQLTGSHAAQAFTDFSIRGYQTATATGAMFATDTGITSVVVKNADFDLTFVTAVNGNSVFSNAKLWTLSGKVAVPFPHYWNAPASFKGQLIVGSLATPPNLGPGDILTAPSLAISCARLLVATYTGPLCQVERASDSTTLDIYPTTYGDIDRNAYTGFCKATTCTVSIAYDHGANGNNCTQGTLASQPSLPLATAGLGNRAAMVFGDAGAAALTCGTGATINDLFATGGFSSAVYAQPAVTTAVDRLWYKANGAVSPGVGVDYRWNNGGTSFTLQEGATTTSGSWITTTETLGAHIQELQYNYSSLANVPTFTLDGNSFSIVTPTQPVGTISSDAAIPLLIGNNAATAGTRGLPGSLGELILWKATPTAIQTEAIRRNQAAYYGVANVN